MSNFRKDIDFIGLFRKLGHSLEEIRVRALESLQSKLDHGLICEADIMHEKQLYIRLLEWFNVPGSSHRGQVLVLLNRLAQQSPGAELLQQIGTVEFLSLLRCDIEACHRPVIDQILEQVMCLPDPDVHEHAPECIYQRPSDSAVWGASMSSAGERSRSHLVDSGVSPTLGVSSTPQAWQVRPSSSAELLSQQVSHMRGPAYFAAGAMGRTADHRCEGQQMQGGFQTDNLFFSGGDSETGSGTLFKLSVFPWLPLTQTDQQVIASTNNSFQSKEPGLLIGSCEFLSDVVFQDFPAEIFLQRPEILKSLLSLVSLPNVPDQPVVIQACKTLTVFIRCLQVRIRYFQDPTLYTSKQDFDSTAPSSVTSTPSSRPPSNYSPHLHTDSPYNMDLGADWFAARRDRGDGQDGESSNGMNRGSSVGLEPDFTLGTPRNERLENHQYLLESDAPRPRHQQLSLPQLCVAVLQRAIPRLRTNSLQLGTSVLELCHEALIVLRSVLDPGIWSDTADAAREVVDRLTDCLDCLSTLLAFHHHNQHEDASHDPELGDLPTHRILYMGLAATLTRFFLLIPLDKMGGVLPESLRSRLPSLILDQALSISLPQCRILCLTVAQQLGMSAPADFQLSLDMCRALTKACAFCAKVDDQTASVEDLSALADDSLPSLLHHLHLPFVVKFVNFISKLCSKKKSDKTVVSQCSTVLLQLLAFPVDSVREVCHNAVLNAVKESLQVSHAASLQTKESLKAKFVMNADILYQLATFGLADSSNKVRSVSSEILHHLLQSQLLMSEGLWQEFVMALVKALPVLQSYTDSSTALGRRLLTLLDPTTSSHNLSILAKLRASLRLLYLSNKSMRLEAAKHLRWFLSNEHGADGKLPCGNDLDLNKVCSCLVLPSTSLVEEDTSRSVFTVQGMLQVFDIFTSDPVDPAVKNSAGEQLALMLKDPRLHAGFKERGGVEIVCSDIQKAVQKTEEEAKEATEKTLSACVSMLKSLVHHDYSLRHTLARDNEIYYTLLRVGLLYHDTSAIKSDTSHVMVLLLFDEVAKFDITSGSADTPGTKFSLPAQVVQRYRLPFKPLVHHTTSPHTQVLPEPESDVLQTSGPQSMMRIAWNIAWQGGLDRMLDSFQTRLFEETNNEFSTKLTLSAVDRTVLQISCVHWQLQHCLADIKNSASHEEVMSALRRMLAYIVVLPASSVMQFLEGTELWYTTLERFLKVTPISDSDQSLLLLVLRFISAALSSLKPGLPGPSSVTPPALSWLVDRLYKPGGPLVSILGKPMSAVGEAEEQRSAGSTLKRSLDRQILQYIISINSSLPYQLCKRVPPIQMRGDFVRCLQYRLNISEAPHFYNLSSLEGTLSCLMHVTARPGWSKACSGLEATSLCSLLLNCLLEVIWSFHIGRGGTSVSFMGKGVTKSTALCLRHLAYEMNNSDKKDWVQNWLYTRQDGNSEINQGLNWLLTLWAYRDSEVRVAGLGIAVALTSCEAGRMLVSNHCKHIPGGVWGAAFSILLDPVECSMVCQQAALLLVNLTSQTMLSGDRDGNGGHMTGARSMWQGPVVTDEDYQGILVGLSALQALVSHTHLYASVSDLLSGVCWASLVQPVLVSTELPLVLDASLISSDSDGMTDGSTLEKTGRTVLTTVTNLSTQPTPNVTARSKASSTQSAGTSGQDSSISSTSTSVGTETPRGREGRYASNPTQEDGHSVTTPGLVAAVTRLMTNLVHLTPHSSLAGLHDHRILSSLIHMINPSCVQSLCEEMVDGQSAGGAACLTLSDVLDMYTAVCDLLTACITTDTGARSELLANRNGLAALASLLLLQWKDKDDIGVACTSVSISVLRLFSSLLQVQGSTALTALSVALGPIWIPFTESMTAILTDHTPDRLVLLKVSIDLIALLLTEESKVVTRDPDRVSAAATLSELLDATLPDVGSQDKPSRAASTGQQLCEVLVSLFEPAMAVSWEEKVRTDPVQGNLRLKIVSALKALLSVSTSAKICALDAGVVETTIEQLKQTHAQLNLETLGLANLSGKKEGPLLQELVLILDFLRTFMHNCTDVKVACHHSGLTAVIQRLWSWSQQDPALLSSVLSLLTAYSAHCSSAASSHTSSVTSSGSMTSGKGSSGGSLLHYVLRMAQQELDRDECTPLLRLTFGLLTNLALNSDCRAVLWKSPFVNQFSQLDPRKRRGKVRAAVDALWCELILSFSFSLDGQQIILKIPDCLTVLMDLMQAGSSVCRHSATLIVRNLCCHASNKPKLLAADKMVGVLMQQIEQKNNESTQLIATSALWALIHNNHKARVQVKNQNVAPRLVEVLHSLQASKAHQRSTTTNNSCLNLKAVIAAVRD